MASHLNLQHPCAKRLVVGVRPENLENRATTPFPTVEPGSAVDEGFYLTLTASLTDRLPLRDRAIQANRKFEEVTTLTEAVDPDIPRRHPLGHRVVADHAEDGDGAKALRLLARIHRYTLNRLRAEIEPVAARAQVLLGPLEGAVLADHDARDAIEQARAAAHVARRKRRVQHAKQHEDRDNGTALYQCYTRGGAGQRVYHWSRRHTGRRYRFFVGK